MTEDIIQSDLKPISRSNPALKGRVEAQTMRLDIFNGARSGSRSVRVDAVPQKRINLWRLRALLKYFDRRMGVIGSSSGGFFVAKSEISISFISDKPIHITELLEKGLS